ncbi:E3 ubiquitin-protein ligase RNF4-like [Physella acuta]|uniref:E3 ubiquitin-protein ligase RNF4-like n=1 Tax=Physella acuta TaxID=109671 RepID=UPI0027DB211C|nr:E3 ubiquitin-protein ligase RNF4-like [Physella acuta]
MALRTVRRRQRNRRPIHNQPHVLEVDDDIIETPASQCIDLTLDISHEVIDLTRNNSLSLIDSPVVVLTHTDNVGPVRSRTGSGRRGRHRSSSQRDNVYSPRRRHIHPNSEVHVLHSDESSDELPDVPFDTPEPNTSANASLLQSPTGIKIICPICLDDVKQVQRRGQQVMSTTCGHIFCEACIKAAINSQHCCPTCRKKLTLRNVHALYI